MDLITPVQELNRRDLELIPGSAGTARLSPTNSLAVEQGEFVVYETGTALGAGKKAKFITGIITGTAAAHLAMQVFTERGRTDTQSSRKIDVLYSHPYEATTNVFDATSGIAIGDELTVEEGTQAAVADRLVLQKAASTEVVYAIALSAVAAATVPLSTTTLRYRYLGPNYVKA
jgi:hypothetical protein